MPIRSPLYPLALSLVIAVSACSGSADAGAADTEAAQPAPEAAEPAAAPAAAEAPGVQRPEELKPADVERYATGAKRKVEMLDEAKRKLQEGSADSLEVLASVLPTALDEGAAKAAGVTVDEWRGIENAASTVLSKRMMGGAMANMMKDVDTTDVPPEQRAQMRENMKQMAAMQGDPFEGLQPETAEAFRARIDELQQLHGQVLGGLMSIGR